MANFSVFVLNIALYIFIICVLKCLIFCSFSLFHCVKRKWINCQPCISSFILKKYSIERLDVDTQSKNMCTPCLYANVDESSIEESITPCLMAIGNEEVQSNPCISNDESYSTHSVNHDIVDDYDELQDAFNELYEKYEDIGKKFIALKKSHAKCDFISKDFDNLKLENESLKNEIKSLKKEKYVSVPNSLESENIELKKEIEYLKKSIDTFTKGNDYFHRIVEKQRIRFNNNGIGYEEENEKKNYSNLFKNDASCSHSNSLCTYCGRHTHYSKFCHFRKRRYKNTKLAWIPKETIMYANPYKPHTYWVPKDKVFRCKIGIGT